MVYLSFAFWFMAGISGGREGWVLFGSALGLSPVYSLKFKSSKPGRCYLLLWFLTFSHHHLPTELQSCNIVTISSYPPTLWCHQRLTHHQTRLHNDHHHCSNKHILQLPVGLFCLSLPSSQMIMTSLHVMILMGLAKSPIARELLYQMGWMKVFLLHLTHDLTITRLLLLMTMAIHHCQLYVFHSLDHLLCQLVLEYLLNSQKSVPLSLSGWKNVHVVKYL